MLAAFHAEILKLRRSLALLLCAAAPFMVALLAGAMLMNRDDPAPWAMFQVNCAALWSFFMLPMTVTALTVLVAQLEHGPRFWNHLLALPVPRWRLYAAKAAVVILLVAAMMTALWLLVPAAGYAAEALAPGTQLTGAPDLAASARLLATMFAGSVLLIAIQLWAALHFKSFVPPLVLGIGGTFASVVAAGARQGAYFPWMIPTNALAADPALASRAIAVGCAGGLVLLLVMLAAMSRREMV
ncbi:MAG TPA: ABC transporter permease [Allosphingosinicella sp.]|nr:ABC transporter permease [Allosphingosinicella sp.]